MALYLSGELVAPNNLREQVSQDLAAIRSEFGEEFPAVNRISFRLPWRPSSILVDLDDATAEEVANGEYHAWDELNEMYEVTDINQLQITPTVVLDFEGMLHSGRLAERYADLPGVVQTWPNSIGGDGPTIYPRQTGNATSYLFRDAWGDCPAGCIYSEYWYFVCGGNQAAFIGHWARHANPEVPDWWDEVKDEY